MKPHILFASAAFFISAHMGQQSWEYQRIKANEFLPNSGDALADKNDAPDVLHYYHSLPLDYLGQIQAYYERMQAENNKYKALDDATQRDLFIKQKDVSNGYLKLAVPGDPKISRLQLYPVKGKEAVLVLEESLCKPHCTENSIRVYHYNSKGEWGDISGDAFAAPDLNAIRRKLKTAYKKQYLEDDVYERRGYDDDEKLKSSLAYVIEPGKIVLKETALPLDVADIRFNKTKLNFK